MTVRKEIREKYPLLLETSNRRTHVSPSELCLPCGFFAKIHGPLRGDSKLLPSTYSKVMSSRAGSYQARARKKFVGEVK